ncbi:MAG: IPT/TIG domain-containing protein [Limisphaerales bacterium]
MSLPFRLPVLSLLAILASTLTTLAAPFVQSFTPNVGPPGTLVTLTGSGFRPSTALPIVQFGTIQANLISVSANTIVAVVPEGATIGPITVTAMPIGNGQYTTPGYFYLPPRVTDFGTRMISGPNIEFEKPVIASPGATLTLVGANFYVPNYPRLLVKVGEIPVNAVVTADSQILATLPQWIETGHVSVHTEVGGTTNLQQLVYGAPLISRFTATAKGGDTIEIHGYNFRTRNAAEFELRIGGAKATVDVLSNTNLTAVVPDAAINGPIVVTVPGGAFITPSNIVIQPRITGFTPDTGAAGTVVRIDGSGFNGATRVDFGSLPATAFKILHSMQMEATVPAGIQTDTLKLVTTNGTAVSTTLFYGTPRVDSLSPASGRPGTQVVAAGVNLRGATGLTLAGLAITGFEVLDNRQIRFEIPAGAASGRLRVTTPGGSATSDVNFVVRGPEPTLTSLSPAEGGPGTTVTLLGSNLSAVTNVTFNGVRASFTATSATTLEAGGPPPPPPPPPPDSSASRRPMGSRTRRRPSSSAPRPTSGSRYPQARIPQSPKAVFSSTSRPSTAVPSPPRRRSSSS